MYYGLNFSLGGVGSYVGSQILADILYTTTLETFVYQTDGSGNIVIDNCGSTGATNDLLMYSGRGINLVSPQAVTVTANYIMWFDYTLGQHQFTTTSKTFTDGTYGNILACANEITSAHLAVFDANPNLVGKLALSGTGTINEVGLVLGAGDQWFACTEKTLGTLYDARGGASATIVNYVETIRTNADFNPKGLQCSAFAKDALNVPTAYSDTALNWDGGSYGDTQWNPSLVGNFWLEEIIGGVVYQHKYDGVNLTTYTNNVAGTPTAHSPENATYKLGKGVYPKVTADPYTTTVHIPQGIYTGTLYTSYDQIARYTILAGI